jgi:probable rRNA maturation factor
MISVEISPSDKCSPDLLINAAQATLDQSGVPDADLSIVLGDNERIRELNREFLGRDAPTDVLSFPADEVDPDTNRRYLGDVILSFPIAKKQAKERGHSVEAELQLLVIHGVLHLLGYDHETTEEKNRMWAFQGGILESMGIAPGIVHEGD